MNEDDSLPAEQYLPRSSATHPSYSFPVDAAVRATEFRNAATAAWTEIERCSIVRDSNSTTC